MTQTILIAVTMMGGLGVAIGVLLAAASKIFYVYVDPKILAVESALPGANCGGCGMPGCSSNAEAIVAGKASPNSCVAAGPEVAQAIAAILGVSVEAKEADIALPGCTYGVKDAATKFIYDGVLDCRAALLIGGGMKVCSVGCLGLGTCARACPFNAIVMGPNGLPAVDETKCTGCGTCERVCPKNIIRLSSVTRRILLEYTTEDCTTPCQRACPAGINIRDYIRKVSEGNYADAVRIIKERNPFPTIIGRICPRPCESECRRQYVDEPVAINFLKRFAADYERRQGKHILPYRAPETGRKVAVIGGGVEGLSAAFFTSRLGHEVTVYEAGPRMGGLLRTAISKQRLPESILDWDIEGLLEMGIKAETDRPVGKGDLTIAGLLAQGFESVFLASGGWDSRLSRGDSARAERTIPGTYLLLDILQNGFENKDGASISRDAVIVGGGKAAINAVDPLKAAGIQNITLIFRESENRMGFDEKDRERLAAAGAAVHYETAVIRFAGEADQLTAIECTNLKSGDTFEISCGTLVLSSGRFPEMIFSRRKPEGAAEETDISQGPVMWEGFGPYKPAAHVNRIGLYSPGDVLTDFEAAIKAIAAGRRAAASIHQRMYGFAVELPKNVLHENSVVQNVNQLENVDPEPRQIMPLCNAVDPGCAEMEMGFDEGTARKEAGRCLQCGLICYHQSAQGVSIGDHLKKSA